ncbi:MAG: M20 family metallopeptidase [Candidatus Bathyarchaeia archaeon]
MERLKERGIRLIERSKGELLDLCRRLIQTSSENPPGDVEGVVSMTREVLGNWGIESRVYRPEKARPNLVSRVGSGKGGLILNGHMDVVPAGDRRRWDFDPYCGEIRGGRVFGRGASDMKGGLAGLIWALVTTVGIEADLAKPLILALVPDEETGSRFGTKWLIEQGKIDGDGCIVGEPSTNSGCVLGEKGLVQLKLSASGIPAHGSLPMLGENAILKITNSFSALQELTKIAVRVPRNFEETIERAKAVIKKRGARATRVGRGKVGRVAEALDHVTINVGTVSGGTKVNVVPEHCESEVDIRIPVGVSSEQVFRESEKLLEPYGVSCEIMSRSEPNYTSQETTLYKVVSKNVREIVGLYPDPIFLTGASDARFFRLRGIPAIHYGPGSIEYAHSYNEAVEAKEVITACKVYLATILDLLG